MEEKYKNAVAEFNKFTNKYNHDDPMISRKYYHTFRVADYAKEIATKEGLNEQDVFIAYLCGLLHDIARFRQAEEYQTFYDIKSFDHGDVGALVLQDNNYIENYIQDKESQNIIIKAVKNHNKFSIEDSLNERELFFAKLVRDADKIDILDKLTNEIKDSSNTIEPEVLQALKEHRLYKYKGKLPNDVSRIVGYLCYVYDLNFNSTLNILKNAGILDRKLNLLEQYVDEDTMKMIIDNLDEVI